MAKTTKSTDPAADIQAAAAALAQLIQDARDAGYVVAMPFQIGHLDAIGVSATEKSLAIAKGEAPPTGKTVAKDGTLQPIEKAADAAASTGGA